MGESALLERNALVEECVPMVRRLALTVASRLPARVEVSDLAQAGFVGLLDAASKFDPDKGVRFWTYAELRIRGSILDSLRGLDWLPRSLRRRRREVDSAASRLESKLGRAPSEEELAAELGVSAGQLRRMMNELGAAEARAEMVEGLDGVAAIVPDPAAEDPEAQLERRELLSHLERALTSLSDREQRVLALYYEQELTMKEVGRRLGVNESRISQIHGRAVRTLRSRLARELRLRMAG